MQPLFAIEAEIHGQPLEARLAARQARSAPVMAEPHFWLEATLRRVSGKSDLAKAIRRQAVADIGAGQHGVADQVRAEIDRDMRLDGHPSRRSPRWDPMPKKLCWPRRVKPASGSSVEDIALALRRAGDSGLDQCGVDERAVVQAEAAKPWRMRRTRIGINQDQAYAMMRPCANK